jgi:carbon-monoxide dehydrogenase medium subunit
MVGLAAAAHGSAKGLADVRLAFFGVGATPVRARKAEAALADGNLDGAVKALGSDLNPSDDVQANASVKRYLAGVLLTRVAKQLAEARA